MFKRVEVTWLDSESLRDQGWHDLEDVERFGESTDMTCMTCGYLLADKPDYIVIGLSISVHDGDPSQFDGIIKIPRCSITKIKSWRD